jgi:hypothetical protein
MTSVDQYIAKQPSPQKELLLELRKVLKETLENPNETMQWGVIAYANGKFYLAALKDSVNVGFATAGLSQEEIALFEGSGKTMRNIKIHSINDITAKNLLRLLKMVNRRPET